MARGPENTFIASIHRHLKETHCEKMNNPYRSGTPDVFYSGRLGDLWVEYKFVTRIPKTANLLPELSANQSDWLELRYLEGRNVAVIVGSKNGGVIYRDMEWAKPMTPTEFTIKLLSRKELAHWIFTQVGAAACPSILQLSTRTK